MAKSTVTAALQSLAEKGMINYEPYGLITLTPEGREAAQKVVVRHRIIKDFLQSVLGLKADQADRTACEMEHAVDRQALERFVCFLAFIRRQARSGTDHLAEFQRFLAEGSGGQRCQECVEQYMKEIEQEVRAPEKR